MANPIFRITLHELRKMVDEDIRFLESDYPEYDIHGNKKNVYKAREYANKLRDFLTLEYFRNPIYKCVSDIFSNLKYWANSTEHEMEMNSKKIAEIKAIKRLKGQTSIFDEYSLSEDEIKRACVAPDDFINELKEEDIRLKKDNKLARFCLAYLADHTALLRGIYK